MTVILNDTDTLEDAVTQILANKERFIVIVSHDNSLHGVMTEGDVLRALWNGLLLKAPLLEIVNTNPYFRFKKLSNKEFLDVYLKLGILFIPIVDSERKLLEVQTLSDVVRESLKVEKI